MARGGARSGAGRKAKPKIIKGATKCIATEVFESLGKEWKHPKDCKCEICRWRGLLSAADERLRFAVIKYLTDRRDGKPAETINSNMEVSGDAELMARLWSGRKRVAGE